MRADGNGPKPCPGLGRGCPSAAPTTSATVHSTVTSCPLTLRCPSVLPGELEWCHRSADHTIIPQCARHVNPGPSAPRNKGRGSHTLTCRRGPCGDPSSFSFQTLHHLMVLSPWSLQGRSGSHAHSVTFPVSAFAFAIDSVWRFISYSGTSDPPNFPPATTFRFDCRLILPSRTGLGLSAARKLFIPPFLAQI